MSWNTNKNPLEYLLQRVEYYEKQERKFINMKKSGKYSNRFSDEDFDMGIKNTRKRIQQFKDASHILAENM